MEKIKTLGRKLNDNKGLILTAVLASVAMGAIKEKVYENSYSLKLEKNEI